MQGDALALRAAPVHDPEQLQEALHRYGGPFLPEVDTEWAAEMRRELEAQAQALAMALGRSLEADQPLAAARAYLQAAALNPCLNRPGKRRRWRTNGAARRTWPSTPAPSKRWPCSRKWACGPPKPTDNRGHRGGNAAEGLCGAGLSPG
ncbi:hypothetical protein [Deinococcus multiflagellatus]|uniref:Uncharacterized protein n=1 Tax=Deinococcus multiflagellatus TaxID=1656887 RepID=A0ABW1ZLK7_9DEIO